MHLKTTISTIFLRSVGALSLSLTLAAGSLAQTPSLGATCLDVDGNSVVDHNDVLLIIRYFLGFRDVAITENTLGENASRTSPPDIVAFIQSRNYDIDGNSATQLSDLVLINRYVSGVSGAALTANAVGEGATRTTETEILGYINSGCSAAQQNVAQATAKLTVRLASDAVLADLVEIKLQHGGSGQVVLRGDKRTDPTMTLGGITLIQPINNPMSTVAVHIDTALMENDHTIFGVRTAKLEDVFSSINVNTSAVLGEGQIVAKRALSGVTFKIQDNFGNIAKVPTLGEPRSTRDEQAKAAVWFPRNDHGGGFNIEPQAITTAAPPGAVGFSKLLIEIKDGVVWDSDGDITSPNQGPQLILNGKIGLEDVRVTTVIDWPSVTAKPHKLGAKVNGTLIVDTNLKLTGGSLAFAAADFLGLDDQDVAKNELDLGFAKLKGVKYEDGRINIGSVAWNITANSIAVAGFNKHVSIPVGVVITFYLGLDGNISASAEFGYAYSAYIEKGGEYNFTNDTFTPYNVFAAGSFPNPNKPDARPATPADYATRPSPTYVAKVGGAVSFNATLGIEAGVALLGIVPLVVDNRIKVDGNVSASLGAASQQGWFGCIEGTLQPTFDSRFKINAVLAAKKSWEWFTGTTNYGLNYEKTLGSWSPPPYSLGGSVSDCAASITADFGHAVVGTGTTAGTLLTELTAQASTSSGSIPSTGYAWYVNERRLTDSNGVLVTGSSLTTPLTPGNHDIKLIVTDSANRRKEVRKAIKVSAMLPVSPATVAPAKPQAVYGWYPKDTKANQLIRFDPSSSKVINSLTETSTLIEYQWNFGDGTTTVTTTTPSVQEKTFPTPGSYNVSLTVIAANGQTSTYTRSIWVGTQPTFFPRKSGVFTVQSTDATGTIWNSPRGLNNCTFSAGGGWRSGPSSTLWSADGHEPRHEAGGYFSFPGQNPYKLIARDVASNALLSVGAQGTFTIAGDRTFRFLMNDDVFLYGDNVGEVYVVYDCVPSSDTLFVHAADDNGVKITNNTSSVANCTFNATGLWGETGFATLVGADGRPGEFYGGTPLPSAQNYSLIAIPPPRLVPSLGAYTLIGTSRSIDLLPAESLTFWINDSRGFWWNNIGTQQVAINCDVSLGMQ